VLSIPAAFFDTTYDGRRYPGAPGVRGLDGGANCQLFAYELLRSFGLEISDFRSSELWSDGDETERVDDLQPLDLLLFNATGDSFGAHVAVHVGDGKAVHLCKRVGKPAIWPLSAFAALPEYRVFIGAKRVRRPQ
jgi:cell wall-associated NlpC family hydrolase